MIGNEMKAMKKTRYKGRPVGAVGRRNHGVGRLGMFIAGRRLGLRMTQKALSEKVGVTQALVSMIEGGLQGISRDRVPAFARALGVTQKFLLSLIPVVVTGKTGKLVVNGKPVRFQEAGNYLEPGKGSMRVLGKFEPVAK